MELKEFVRLDPNQIRRDKELMQLFVNFYEAAFSFIPKCVGCAFKSGFRKLKKHAETSEKNINFDKNIIEMESKTFILKKQYQLKILSYKKEGITHRCYGYNLTESFAKELVNIGKTDLFATLPKEVEEVKGIEKASVTVIDYSSLNHREELLPLYSDVKEKTGKKALSNKKEDIISFLKENES